MDPDVVVRAVEAVGGPGPPASAGRHHQHGRPTLGLTHVDAIVTTLNVLGLLIADCIGISQAKIATDK